jgi:hypothetical protein
MTKYASTVRNDVDRERAVRILRSLPLGEGRAYEVTLERREARMSDPQRRLLFALCADIAAQVDFPGGGRASAEAWKDLLTGLLRGQRMVREGEVVVVIGGGLSGATRTEASDLIEFVQAWGAERGVRFAEPERGAACG